MLKMSSNADASPSREPNVVDYWSIMPPQCPNGAERLGELLVGWDVGGPPVIYAWPARMKAFFERSISPLP